MRQSIRKCAMAVLVSLCALAGFTSCCDDNDPFSITSSNIDKYLYGKIWSLWGKDKTEYTFYRNHLVMSYSTGDKIVGGMLTYDTSLYFGTWHTEGDKLITKFTAGPYKDVLEKIFYGTLTVTELSRDKNEITFTAPSGKTCSLNHYWNSLDRRTFTDYTDASDHDRALQGKWKTTVLWKKYGANGIPVDFIITINQKGEVRFQAESENIDFTTTCTTKNGHVTFTHIYLPNSLQYSYIYVRTEKTLKFFSEDNAFRSWQWEKV